MSGWQSGIGTFSRTVHAYVAPAEGVTGGFEIIMNVDLPQICKFNQVSKYLIFMIYMSDLNTATCSFNFYLLFLEGLWR